MLLTGTKAVIMESGFCVLRGFIVIFGREFYESSLVKKYTYRTTVIYGEGINKHFYQNNIGKNYLNLLHHNYHKCHYLYTIVVSFCSDTNLVTQLKKFDI